MICSSTLSPNQRHTTFLFGQILTLLQERCGCKVLMSMTGQQQLVMLTWTRMRGPRCPAAARCAACPTRPARPSGSPAAPSLRRWGTPPRSSGGCSAPRLRDRHSRLSNATAAIHLYFLFYNTAPSACLHTSFLEKWTGSKYSIIPFSMPPYKLFIYGLAASRVSSVTIRGVSVTGMLNMVHIGADAVQCCSNAVSGMQGSTEDFKACKAVVAGTGGIGASRVRRSLRHCIVLIRCWALHSCWSLRIGWCFRCTCNHTAVKHQKTLLSFCDGGKFITSWILLLC